MSQWGFPHTAMIVVLFHRLETKRTERYSQNIIAILHRFSNHGFLLSKVMAAEHQAVKKTTYSKPKRAKGSVQQVAMEYD